MLIAEDQRHIPNAGSFKYRLNDFSLNDMIAKLTRNGYSIQAVIPSELCEKYGFSPGQSIVLDERDDGIFIRRSLLDRPSPVAWTIGYEGMVLDGFVSKLKSNGIKQVIDVRELPLSRKTGFSKTSLESSLLEAGLVYFHLRDLGTPKKLRDEFRNGGSASAFFDRYKDHLKRNWRAFDVLLGLATIRPTAIMCLEKDHEHCHRKVIAERLEEEGFRMVHV